jgi:hypothetical protein
MIKRLLILSLLGFALSPMACGGDGPGSAGDFCNQIQSVVCNKVFECVPPGERDASFTTEFGSTAAACAAQNSAQQCGTAASDCPKYNASAAQTCLNKLSATSCTDTSTDLPTECNAACGQ